jgi:hypothetical protein
VTRSIKFGSALWSHASLTAADLELDALAVEFNIFNLKIDADGGNECGRKRIVGVSQQEASFPYTCGDKNGVQTSLRIHFRADQQAPTAIANHQQFDLHVEGVLMPRHGAGRCFLLFPSRGSSATTS